MSLFTLLGCLALLVHAQYDEDRDPWVGTRNDALMAMRDCLPHEYVALLDTWFLRLNDTKQYSRLNAKALDALQRALEAHKPICRALVAGLHGTLRAMTYQMAQDQYRNVQQGWPETVKHLKALRHTLPQDCSEEEYVSRRVEIRRCMREVRNRVDDTTRAMR